MENILMPDVDELNQSIVDHISNAFNSFCLGEYKNSINFPVVAGNVGYESLGIKTTYGIIFQIEKNKNKVLKYSNVMIRNIKVQESKKRKNHSVKK